MSPSESKLLQLLKERSFKSGGSFRLASGTMSDYYIDGKMTAVYSEAVPLIGEILYERTKGLEIEAIGGLEVGAVPLTTAAVYSYQLHGRKMEGFWVRDKAKTHGTKKLIEGGLRAGARVAIVDDVFTKGGSAMRASGKCGSGSAKCPSFSRSWTDSKAPENSFGRKGSRTTSQCSRSATSG